MRRIFTVKRTLALVIVIAVGWLVIPSIGGAGPTSSRGLPGLLLGKLNEIIELQKQILEAQDILKAGIDACAPPDLVPLPVPGDTTPSGYCRLEQNSTLIVRVLNQGGSGADASTLRVTFATELAPTVVEVSTPALPFGASADVEVPIPGGCFAPDCGFQISVDHTNVVIESNELNNSAAGLCIG